MNKLNITGRHYITLNELTKTHCVQEIKTLTNFIWHKSTLIKQCDILIVTRNYWRKQFPTVSMLYIYIKHNGIWSCVQFLCGTSFKNTVLSVNNICQRKHRINLKAFIKKHMIGCRLTVVTLLLFRFIECWRPNGTSIIVYGKRLDVSWI